MQEQEKGGDIHSVLWIIHAYIMLNLNCKEMEQLDNHIKNLVHMISMMCVPD